MSREILVFLLIFFVSPGAYAEENFKLKSADTMINKSFDLANGKGKVHVIVHDKGHLHGMPYVVDLRPSCQGSNKSWEELETLDVKSACAVDMNSLTVNKDRTEISINIHNPNVDSYNTQMKKGLRNVSPECDAKAVKHTFSIKDFCS